MESIEVDERLRLRPVAAGDAGAIYALIEADRERLARWLPWAAGQTLTGTRDFIARSQAQEARGDGFQAVLERDGEVAGIAGYHAIDPARPLDPRSATGSPPGTRGRA
jgi:ribosomal-protein-serine acetyltransferase